MARTMYLFNEMAEVTNLDSRIVERIKNLIDSCKVIVKAAKPNETFIACNAKRVFSYDAVLYVATQHAHYTIDKKNRPSDVLAKVAEILTSEAKRYGKF